MTEIKISVSETLDKMLQKKADVLGIKKTELLKNLVINYINNSNSADENKKRGKNE